MHPAVLLALLECRSSYRCPQPPPRRKISGVYFMPLGAFSGQAYQCEFRSTWVVRFALNWLRDYRKSFYWTTFDLFLVQV